MRIFLSLLFGVMLFTASAQFSNFPVTLSIPYDYDTITNVNPVFVWQCNLSAIQNDPRLSLRFAMTEKENTQSSAEAITSNLPLCTAEGLLSTSYPYPSTLQDLQAGHTYVWQVQLLFNDQVVEESEPWQFTIADPQPVNHQFIALNPGQDGSFHTFADQHAWLVLKDEYDFESQNARIRKPNGEVMQINLDKVYAGEEEEDGNLFNESSQHYLHYDLDAVPRMQGIYTLTITSKNNQVYFLNFILE